MVILNINSRKTVLFPIFDESYLRLLSFWDRLCGPRNLWLLMICTNQRADFEIATNAWRTLLPIIFSFTRRPRIAIPRSYRNVLVLVGVGTHPLWKHKMESPPPSPQPSPQPAIEYNDLFAFMLGLSAFVITLIAVRIAHVYIARKSMQRNNYHSKRQWIASLSLNFLSIFTCFFTLVNIISDIVSVGLIISKDNTTGDLRDAMGEIFFVSYALQNLSVRFYHTIWNASIAYLVEI